MESVVLGEFSSGNAVVGEGENIDEKDGEAKEDLIDNGDEFIKAHQARRPRILTQKKMDEHYPLHLKYADWCPDCVL